MKDKLLILTVLICCLCSCRHKDLWYGEDTSERQSVTVIFDWPADAVKPSNGMRVNLFSRNTHPDYGRVDMGGNGGTLSLPVGADYLSVSYNYHGNQMLFSDQHDPQQIRVSCSSLARSTYNQAFPLESTYTQPDADLWAGHISSFPIVRSESPLEMIFEPLNVVKTYTFEILNVVGTEFITDTRGAISGMSNCYYLGTQRYCSDPATIFFAATADKANHRITGSFRTFSRQSMANIFTIEILFQSTDGRIIQQSWDVTPQIEPDGHYHIRIEDSGIEVPDETGGEDPGGDGWGVDGWGVDVKDWDRVPVPLT